MIKGEFYVGYRSRRARIGRLAATAGVAVAIFVAGWLLGNPIVHGSEDLIALCSIAEAIA